MSTFTSGEEHDYPDPETRTEDGFTVADVVVRIGPHGLATVKSASKLVERCSRYTRGVFLLRVQPPNQHAFGHGYSCKQIIQMILSEAYDGTLVRVKVEGEDDRAEEILFDVCKALDPTMQSRQIPAESAHAYEMASVQVVTLGPQELADDLTE